MTNNFYEFPGMNDTATLCFKMEKERFLEPDILAELITLPQRSKNIRRLILTGRSPVWLYAFMTYHFVQNGTQCVVVKQPGYKKIQVFPVGQNTSLRSPSWYSLQKNNDTDNSFICEIKKTNEAVSIDVLQQEELHFPSNISRIILTGKGSVWMYAALGAAAAQAGIPNTWIDIPRYPCYISIGNTKPGISELKQYNLNGICIAIVGDPNSGKSIFSKCLEHAVSKQIPKSWLFDCDIASPTPNWFIDLCQKQQIEEANSLRNNIKTSWDHNKEELVARALYCAKKNLKLVIADFPGGIHNEKENLHLRIPQGREVMLSPVDYFIILGKKAKPEILQSWRNNLKQLNLDNKIIAEFQSDLPEEDFSVQFTTNETDNVLRGIVRGLKRSRSINNSDDRDSQIMLPLLNRIMKCLPQNNL